MHVNSPTLVVGRFETIKPIMNIILVGFQDMVGQLLCTMRSVYLQGLISAHYPGGQDQVRITSSVKTSMTANSTQASAEP